MGSDRESELWTTSDVAAYLGVRPGTVSAYRHRGQMPAPEQTLGERTHLWRASTIREWNASRKVRTTAEQTAAAKRSDPHEWLTFGERDLYNSEWVRLSLVDVEPPHGERFEHHVVTLRPAAMTAVLDDAREHVGLIWRHRFAPGLWNWELPGGLVDDGEDPATTAAREVEEELGLKVKNLRHLVTFEPMVGMVRAQHHVYCAVGYEDIGAPAERNEGEGVTWIPLTSVRQLIDEGKVSNSGTLVALLHLLAFGTE